MSPSKKVAPEPMTGEFVEVKPEVKPETPTGVFAGRLTCSPTGHLRPSMARATMAGARSGYLEFEDKQRNTQFRSNGTKMGGLVVNDLKRMKTAAVEQGATNTLKYVFTFLFVVLNSSAFSFLAKICYGDVENRPAAPHPHATVFLAMISCAFVYLLMNWEFTGKGVGGVMEKLGQGEYWIACLPYAGGQIATYLLYLRALQDISAATAVCLTQARLVLDIAMAYLFLSKPLTNNYCAIVVSLFIMSATHFLVLPESEMSTDAYQGLYSLIVYTVVMAVTYAYFPWAIPKFKLPSAMCLLIVSLEISIFSAAMYVVDHNGFSGFFDNFEKIDVAMIVAWVLFDAALFIVPLILSPLTFACAIVFQIPVLFFLENWWFDQDLNVRVFSTMVGVFASVIGYTSYELDRQRFLAKTAEAR